MKRKIGVWILFILLSGSLFLPGCLWKMLSGSSTNLSPSPSASCPVGCCPCATPTCIPCATPTPTCVPCATPTCVPCNTPTPCPECQF